ncbi:MAG: hypothetical protein DLM68_13230 [Hyphomicrobiales bacterium]|nr:MAG: hypothetical protein DLM68_13230 [Hyphomicrobiales bacterium]
MGAGLAFSRSAGRACVPAAGRRGWPRTTGEFKSFEGRIDIDFDRPSRNRVDFRVAAKSVDVNSATLDDYLRSEAFLNVTNFPGMRFISRTI